MTANTENLKNWLHSIADLIAHSENLDPELYRHFVEEPELALDLIDIIVSMDDNEVDEERTYYSACVFALEICVAQLQAATDAGNKSAQKCLSQLMAHMAQAIRSEVHSLSFWLPILNAFYEVHIELSDELKAAYVDLASQDEMPFDEDEATHLDSIRGLLHELSDLSVYDIAEHLFAQSYAMPAEFFADLILDLYSIDEGQEVALLMLLHPKAEVRDVILSTLDSIFDKITLSSASLSRLKTIRNWYPKEFHGLFDGWIKAQRKKGVVFHSKNGTTTASMRIKASEVDGSGAQGIFIHCIKKKDNRLCGLLLKYDIGIKDVWFTPDIPQEDIERYYDESFDDSVMLRAVDETYVLTMTNHFLAESVEAGDVPNLHLLEMQEELGLKFMPEKIAVKDALDTLMVQIEPFTPERIQEALKRSKNWPHNKQFTESWFIESAQIDKIVNQHCSFVEGIKVCDFEQAMKDIFKNELERQRERWVFHFLWVALWLKPKARKNEKTWQDALLIAHAIHSDMSLEAIPIMQDICNQTVINSIETMHERRTHLTQQ